MASGKKVKPFKQGELAFKQGRIGDNPYEPYTPNHWEYELGFNKAYFKNKRNQEKFESRRRGKRVSKEEQAQ